MGVYTGIDDGAEAARGELRAMFAGPVLARGHGLTLCGSNTQPIPRPVLGECAQRERTENSGAPDGCPAGLPRRGAPGSVPPAGFEPATPGLGELIWRSSMLG